MTPIPPLLVRRALVRSEQHVRRADVLFTDGRIARTGSVPLDEARGATVIDGDGLWMIPGVYDCHSHLSWGAFHAVDRDGLSPDEIVDATAAALTATLTSGVTSVRDAGGLSVELAERAAATAAITPRLQLSQELLGAEDARGAEHLRRRVETLVGSGSRWIKLLATGGLSARRSEVLRPVFSAAEIRSAVEAAHGAGAKVMMHAWGGPALDWGIDAGIDSLEHGIHLTREQADSAAAGDVTFVPTVEIYRATANRADTGDLPAEIGRRARAAAAAHPTAVAHAVAAGVRIAVGTDFASPEQHGTNLCEIAALMDCGVPADQALEAATVNGAILFGEESEAGALREGFRGDAVLLNSDPTLPITFRDRGTVMAVIQDGTVVSSPLSGPNPAMSGAPVIVRKGAGGVVAHQTPTR